MPKVSELVNINVGGTLFTCWKSLLIRHNCLFKSCLQDKNFSKLCDTKGNLFFDRSPTVFEFILNALRQHRYEIVIEEEEQEIFSNFTFKELQTELKYYGLTNVIKLKIEGPPKPTIFENATKQVNSFFGNVKQLGVYNFIVNNKYSIEDFFITSIVSLFYVFWILKFFVMFGSITTATYKIFYPIYMIPVMITCIIIANVLTDSGSKLPYLFFFCVALLITFYLSFFFKKFHYLINEMEYYRWMTIGSPILFLGALGLLFVTFLIIKDLFTSHRSYNLEDYFFGHLPYSIFYTVFAIFSYLDDGYFQSFWLTFGMLFIYIIIGFSFYVFALAPSLPFTSYASKDDNLFGIMAFISLFFGIYLFNYWLSWLPNWVTFLPVDILMLGMLYLLYIDKI
eukprot:gene12163-5653_t